jgi:hypothetical protein
MAASGLASSGTLARCAPSLPGPVGSVVSSTDYDGRAVNGTTGALATGEWIPLDLESADADGQPPAQPRRSIRIVHADASATGSRHLMFMTQDEARKAAALLAGHPAAASQLRRLGGATGVFLAAWTAQRLTAGTLKVLWQTRELTAVTVAPPPVPMQAPARRTVAPASPSAPTPQESTFPPDFDAAAVARSLKDAAADGIPFCEECMKAKMAQDAAAVGAA